MKDVREMNRELNWLPKELYSVNEPYASIMIVENPATRERLYTVVEPTLTETEKKNMEGIREIFKETVDITMGELGPRAGEYLMGKTEEIAKNYRMGIDDRSLGKIKYYLVRNSVGYGRIDVLMRDPNIEDISCDGPGRRIYIIHRNYGSIPTNVIFEPEELDSWVMWTANRTGREINFGNPRLDGTLPDGSRIQTTLGGQVSKGSHFTIRKFREKSPTVIDLIMNGTFSSKLAAYFWMLVRNKMSMFVCGETGSGKTTTLNAICTFIPPDSKIVSVEETPEVRLYHENWIQSIIRPGKGGGEAGEIGIFALIKDSLRQRPDYLILQEIRGAEAPYVFQGIETGHAGLTTFHATSMRTMIERLESEPLNISRRRMLDLDAVLFQERFERPDGSSVRKIRNVSEVNRLEEDGKTILANDYFYWDPLSDTYKTRGNSILIERIANRDVVEEGGKTKRRTVKEVYEEIERMKEVLDWMVKTNKRDYVDVGSVARQYNRNPDMIYKKAHEFFKGRTLTNNQ